MKTIALAALACLAAACGGPCAPFAGDPVSYGRCDFSERQCEERCGSRGVRAFYCQPPTGAQASLTCTCACGPAGAPDAGQPKPQA